MKQTQEETNRDWKILQQRGYPNTCSINNLKKFCYRCQKYTKTIESDQYDECEISENCLECNFDKTQEIFD